MVLRCTVNICNPTFITDSDKGSFHPTEQHRLEEIYDFFLAALNGSGQYRKATDFLTALHSVGKSCSVSLVADTIRGLLSDCASSPGNFRFIERIAVLSQRPPSGIPASVAKMREASEDSQSAPPCDQPPKKRSRLGK
ncbi:hypothetical protein HYPSUDRAFT_31809 [Hypholoma sublateritium FD-334 SS-4]|uniref:Uncharacterized protein n=1 Tax=Hypholoma sublateritium (strain FD-334 SS-4) TaxID=945553 RepID=A0A0D2LP15_HYPSF|nr:hypothetical protein HYPSUDRAFT_31809 [Hypholoma sublateritium FD-334 SS-4]